MKFKKLIVFLQVCLLCLFADSIVTGEQVNATEISDWAKEYISTAKEIHIIPDDNDDLKEAITREEFCEAVYGTAMAVNGQITTENIKCGFTDTDNYKIEILYRLGVVQGKSDTEFAPYDLLTREEAATLVVRMINALIPMEVTRMWFEYEDINQISEWALTPVQVISNMGFMEGVGGNRFAPKETYTKEQAIATLVRVYESTRRTYSYETPLGVIETETNCDSHINFPIVCDANVMLGKGNELYITEKTVKALTNQTSSMLVSFDDFAELFDGEWSLTDGVLEFNYNPEIDVKVKDWQRPDSSMGGEWPNKTEEFYVVQFSHIGTVMINGEEREIKGQYGGKVHPSSITMYNGELYIPVQMVAELLGYDKAALDII